MTELINPSHLLTMDTSQLDNCLEEIRARRIRAGEQYEKAKKRKSETTVAGLARLLEKQCEILNKKLSIADKAINSAEAAIAAIYTLRLQYDDMKGEEL
jgi:hypothetical protein